MFKYTRHQLKKLERLLEENDYVLRYEKGHFQSGYCILHDKDVIIVNKFFSVEGKINSLLEIMDVVEIDPDQLSDDSLKFYEQLQKLD
jgi:hypothetical protein